MKTKTYQITILLMAITLGVSALIMMGKPSPSLAMMSPLDPPPPGVPPWMTYQGVLTDTSGNPVPDDTYSMVFRLWDVATWEDRFSETKDVEVVNGVFTTILGSATNPLPVEYFGHGLQLEIDVEGDRLTPKQWLTGSPYAFTLHPGSVIWDYHGVDQPALTIEKMSSGPALRLDGGALESDQYSYFWVPVGLGYEVDEVPQMTRVHNYGGGLCLSRSAPAKDYFVLPLSLPGVLLGQTISIDQVTIYYRCDGDQCGDTGTAITASYLDVTIDPDNTEVKGLDTANYYDTTEDGDSYDLSFLDGVYEIGTDPSRGGIAVLWEFTFADGDDQICLSAVRVRAKHE
jgi:hypothetical protein